MSRRGPGRLVALPIVGLGALVLVWAVGATGPAQQPQTSLQRSPTAETFTCTPAHVWDGDGPIWCAEGPRIRLSGIAAREKIEGGRLIDAGCNDGHPGPAMPGPAARDVLVKLLGKRQEPAPTAMLWWPGRRSSAIGQAPLPTT